MYQEVLHAITLIEDAIHRRTLKILPNRESLNAWRMYNHPLFLGLHQFCLVILFLLLLVEDPAVELLDVEPYYYIPMVIETLLLIFFAVRLNTLRIAQAGYSDDSSSDP